MTEFVPITVDVGFSSRPLSYTNHPAKWIETGVRMLSHEPANSSKRSKWLDHLQIGSNDILGDANCEIVTLDLMLTWMNKHIDKNQHRNHCAVIDMEDR